MTNGSERDLKVMSDDELQGGEFTVMEGLDGWLFLDEAEHINVMQLYTDEAYMPKSVISEWCNALRDRRQFFAERNITYVTVVAPDACLVYPEHLPETVKLSGSSPFSQITDALDPETAAQCIHPVGVLIDGKSEQPTYRQADSHWTDWGAYLVHQATMQHLSARRSDIEMLDAERVTWSVQPAFGALGAVMDDERVEMLRVAEIVDSQVAVRQMVTNEVRDGFLVVEQDRPELPTAVIFRDSFMTNAATFFSESFRRVVYCTHPNSVLLDLIEREQPDVVIFAIGERRLYRPPLDSTALNFRSMFGDLMMDDQDAVAAEVASRALLRAGDAAAALKANDEAMKSGVNARLLLHRARCFEAIEDPKAELECLRAAVFADPNDGSIWHAFARALRGIGGIGQAVLAAREATRVEPDYAVHWTYEVSLLIEAGKPDAAVKLARDALERHRSRSDVHRAYCFALIAAGELELATQEIRTAVSSDPDSIPYRRLLASVLVRRENWEEAETTLRDLVRSDPDEPANAEWLEIVRHKLEVGA